MKPLILATLSCLAFSQTASAETLTVIVQKTTNVGTVRAGIYVDQATFEADQAVAEMTIPASDGETRLIFEDLAPGRYGIALFQDINGNEVLDTNLLGAPNEPFGFSNDPSIGFSAPDFEAFSFDLDGSPLELAITLNGS